VIEADKATYPISWMCWLPNMPRSSFYGWPHRAGSAAAARRRELLVLVQAAFEAGRSTCLLRVSSTVTAPAASIPTSPT
jgi:hypothetical protein